MKLTRRAALDGNQLDAVDAAVVIQGVDAGTPKETVQSAGLYGGFGSRETMQHYDSLDATVTYAILKPKKDIAARRTVFDKVNAWAVKKGWLTMSQMDGKRLRVDKVIIPAMGDPMEWTAEYTITFRAYKVPFWQDATATNVTDTLAAETQKSVAVTAPGSAPTVIDVEFTNTSGGTCTAFEVEIGGKKMELTGLALANNAKLTISHGTDGILSITAGSASAYGNQEPGGLSDLVVQPGSNTVKVTADAAGSLKISLYGRYL